MLVDLSYPEKGFVRVDNWKIRDEISHFKTRPERHRLHSDECRLLNLGNSPGIGTRPCSSTYATHTPAF